MRQILNFDATMGSLVAELFLLLLISAAQVHAGESVPRPEGLAFGIRIKQPLLLS